MAKVTLHLFSFKPRINEQHSFLVANDQLDNRTKLETLELPPDILLRDVRSRIEVSKIRGMCRRTVLFGEVLQTMHGALKNVHGYPGDLASSAYVFGVDPEGIGYEKDGTGAVSDGGAAAASSASVVGDTLPTIISPETEEQLKLMDVLVRRRDETFPRLYIVPVSQIDPLTMKCSDVRDTEVSHDEPVVREALDKIFVSLRDLAMPL